MCWILPSEGFAGASVEFAGDGVEFTLADLGEGEMSAQPERGQVPHVLDPFGLRIEERALDMPREAAQNLVLLAAADTADVMENALTPGKDDF